MKRQIVLVLTGFLLGAGVFFGLGHSLVQNPDPFGGHVMTQVGIVVDDVEQAARAYAGVLGMEVPAVSITDPYEKAHTRYEGASTGARAKLAFFRLENITIELIEPVDGPSTWQEFLQKEGPGVHHIAFHVDGMDQNIAYLQQYGGRLVQRGDFTGGSYAYVDATDNLAVILELLTSTD